MKKIILIFIMIGIYSLCQAKPWQDYTEFTSPADGDHFLINDISETGPPDNNAAGTLKRLPWSIVQPRDSDLTSLAAIAFSANMLSFLDAADYAEMKTLLSIPMQADCSGITAGLCLDTDTGELYSWDGDSVELVGVLNWQALHANLTAIADAEAGVTNPGITMYDNNDGATGTSFIYGQSVDGTKAIVMSIGVEEETTGNAVYIELDGINERVDVLKPLNAGIDIAIKSASYNIETTESDVCRKVYYRYGGSGQDTFTLPALTQCNSISGYGKEFYFLNYDSGEGEDIWIEPAGTDKIWLNGVSCTAGLGVQCTTDQGDRLHIFGSSETNWTVQDYTGTCACETP